MDENAKIELEDENGEKIELYVVEETSINNISYLLTCDDVSDEANAYILKDISDPIDEDAIYTFVDDEAEIEYIGKIFSELLDDEDIGLE